MNKKTYNTPLPCHQLTDEIIAVFYNLINRHDHRRGIPEGAFCNMFATALRADNLFVEVEKTIPMRDQGRKITTLRADLVIERLVVIELKNVERISRKDLDQGTLYLAHGGYPAGLILNYGMEKPIPKRIPLPKHYHKECRKCPGS